MAITTRQPLCMFCRLPCMSGRRLGSNSILDIGAAETGMTAIIGEAGTGLAVDADGAAFTTIGYKKPSTVGGLNSLDDSS